MWRKMPEQSQRSVSHSHASKIKWKRNTNSLIRSESWLCGDGSVSSVKVMGSKMAHVIVINSIATATVVHISFWFFFFCHFGRDFGARRADHHAWQLGRCDGKYIMAMTQNYYYIEISQKANSETCVHRQNGQKFKRFDLLACCSRRGVQARTGTRSGTFRKFKFRKIYMQISLPNRAALSLSRIGYSWMFLVNGSPFVYSVYRCVACECDELQSKSHAYPPITNVIKI